MSSLYQLTNDIAALELLLEQTGGDVSEGTEGQTLEKWAQEYEWKLSAKVDSYGELHRNLEALGGALDEEIKRLRARKTAIDNRAQRLLDLAKFSMEKLGLRKLEGTKFTIAIQKAGGKDPMEVLVDAGQLPEAYRKTTILIEADKEKLRTGLEQKDPALEGKAKLGQRGDYVRIR